MILNPLRSHQPLRRCVASLCGRDVVVQAEDVVRVPGVAGGGEGELLEERGGDAVALELCASQSAGVSGTQR